MNKAQFYFPLLLILLLGCAEGDRNLVDGTYVGKLERIPLTNTSSHYMSGEISLTIQRDTFYTTLINPVITIPYDGPRESNGKFVIDADSLVFFAYGTRTADFDWNTFINGTYPHTFDGSRLQFGRKLGNSYEYRFILTRVREE